MKLARAGKSSRKVLGVLAVGPVIACGIGCYLLNEFDQKTIGMRGDAEPPTTQELAELSLEDFELLVTAGRSAAALLDAEARADEQPQGTNDGQPGAGTEPPPAASLECLFFIAELLDDHWVRESLIQLQAVSTSDGKAAAVAALNRQFALHCSEVNLAYERAWKKLAEHPLVRLRLVPQGRQVQAERQAIPVDEFERIVLEGHGGQAAGKSGEALGAEKLVAMLRRARNVGLPPERVLRMYLNGRNFSNYYLAPIVSEFPKAFRDLPHVRRDRNIHAACVRRLGHGLVFREQLDRLLDEKRVDLMATLRVKSRYSLEPITRQKLESFGDHLPQAASRMRDARNNAERLVAWRQNEPSVEVMVGEQSLMGKLLPPSTGLRNDEKSSAGDDFSEESDESESAASFLTDTVLMANRGVPLSSATAQARIGGSRGKRFKDYVKTDIELVGTGLVLPGSVLSELKFVEGQIPTVAVTTETALHADQVRWQAFLLQRIKVSESTSDQVGTSAAARVVPWSALDHKRLKITLKPESAALECVWLKHVLPLRLRAGQWCSRELPCGPSYEAVAGADPLEADACSTDLATVRDEIKHAVEQIVGKLHFGRSTVLLHGSGEFTVVHERGQANGYIEGGAVTLSAESVKGQQLPFAASSPSNVEYELLPVLGSTLLERLRNCAGENPDRVVDLSPVANELSRRLGRLPPDQRAARLVDIGTLMANELRTRPQGLVRLSLNADAGLQAELVAASSHSQVIEAELSELTTECALVAATGEALIHDSGKDGIRKETRLEEIDHELPSLAVAIYRYELGWRLLELQKLIGTSASAHGDAIEKVAAKVSGLMSAFNQNNGVAERKQFQEWYSRCEQIITELKGISAVSQQLGLSSLLAEGPFLAQHQLAVDLKLAQGLDEEKLKRAMEAAITRDGTHYLQLPAPRMSDLKRGQPSVLLGYRRIVPLLPQPGAAPPGKGTDVQVNIVMRNTSSIGQFVFPGRTADLQFAVAGKDVQGRLRVETVGPTGCRGIELVGSGGVQNAETDSLLLRQELLRHSGVVTFVQTAGDGNLMLRFAVDPEREGEMPRTTLIDAQDGTGALLPKLQLEAVTQLVQQLPEAERVHGELWKSLVQLRVQPIAARDFGVAPIQLQAVFPLAKSEAVESGPQTTAVKLVEHSWVELSYDPTALSQCREWFSKEWEAATKELASALPEWMKIVGDKVQVSFGTETVELPHQAQFYADASGTKLQLLLQGSAQLSTLMEVLSLEGFEASSNVKYQLSFLNNSIASGSILELHFELTSGDTQPSAVVIRIPSNASDPLAYARYGIVQAMQTKCETELTRELRECLGRHALFIQRSKLPLASPVDLLLEANRTFAKALSDGKSVPLPEDLPSRLEQAGLSLPKLQGSEVTKEWLSKLEKEVASNLTKSLEVKFEADFSLSLPGATLDLQLTESFQLIDNRLKRQRNLALRPVDGAVPSLEQVLGPWKAILNGYGLPATFGEKLAVELQADHLLVNFPGIAVGKSTLMLAIDREGRVEFADSTRRELIASLLQSGILLRGLNELGSSLRIDWQPLIAEKWKLAGDSVVIPIQIGDEVTEVHFRLTLEGVVSPSREELRKVCEAALKQLGKKALEDALAILPKEITLLGIAGKVIESRKADGAELADHWSWSVSVEFAFDDERLQLKDIGIKDDGGLDFRRVQVTADLIKRLTSRLPALQLELAGIRLRVSEFRASVKPERAFELTAFLEARISNEETVEVEVRNLALRFDGSLDWSQAQIGGNAPEKLAKVLSSVASQVGLPDIGVRFDQANWDSQQQQVRAQVIVTAKFFEQIAGLGLTLAGGEKLSTEDVAVGTLTLRFAGSRPLVRFEGAAIETFLSQKLSEWLRGQGPLKFDGATLSIQEVLYTRHRLTLTVLATYEGEFAISLVGQAIFYLDEGRVDFNLKMEESASAAIQAYLNRLIPNSPFFMLRIQPFDVRDRSITFGFTSSFFGMSIGLDNIRYKSGTIDFPRGAIIKFSSPLRVQMGSTPFMLVQPGGLMNLKSKDITIEVKLTVSGVATENLINVQGSIGTNLKRPARYHAEGVLYVINLPVGKATATLDLELLNFKTTVSLGQRAIIALSGDAEIQLPAAGRQWFITADASAVVLNLEVMRSQLRIDPNGVDAHTRVDFLILDAAVGFTSDLRLSNPHLTLSCHLNLEIASAEVGIDASVPIISVYVSATAAIVTVNLNFDVPGWAVLTPPYIAAKIAEALAPTGIELGDPSKFKPGIPHITINGGKIKLFGDSAGKGGKKGDGGESKGGPGKPGPAGQAAENAEKSEQNAQAGATMNPPQSAEYKNRATNAAQHHAATAVNAANQATSSCAAAKTAAAEQAAKTAAGGKTGVVKQDESAGAKSEGANEAAGMADQLRDSTIAAQKASAAMDSLSATIKAQIQRLQTESSDDSNPNKESAKEQLEKAEQLKADAEKAWADLQEVLKGADKSVVEAVRAKHAAAEEALAAADAGSSGHATQQPLGSGPTPVTLDDSGNVASESTPMVQSPPVAEVDAERIKAALAIKPGSPGRIGDGLGNNVLLLASHAMVAAQGDLEPGGDSQIAVKKFLASDNGKKLQEVLGKHLKVAAVTFDEPKKTDVVLVLQKPDGGFATVYEHAFVLETVAQLQRGLGGTSGQTPEGVDLTTFNGAFNAEFEKLKVEQPQSEVAWLRLVTAMMTRALWRGQCASGSWTYQPWATSGWHYLQVPEYHDMSLQQAAILGIRSGVLKVVNDDLVYDDGLLKDAFGEGKSDENTNWSLANRRFLEVSDRARRFADACYSPSAHQYLKRPDGGNVFTAGAALAWTPESTTLPAARQDEARRKLDSLMRMMLEKQADLLAGVDSKAEPPQAGFMFHYKVVYTARAANYYLLTSPPEQLPENAELQRQLGEFLLVLSGHYEALCQKKAPYKSKVDYDVSEESHIAMAIAAHVGVRESLKTFRRRSQPATSASEVAKGAATATGP